MMVFFLWCMAVAASNLGIVGASHPGMQVRVTSKGLDYANKLAIQSLVSYMAGVTLPEQHEGDVKVHSINVQQFYPPSSTLKANPGRGLIWTGSGAYIALHGDFQIRKKILLVPVRESGDLNCRLSGVQFSVELNLGVDNGGRPTVAVGHCHSAIGDLSLDMHGGLLTAVLNLFRGRIGREMKDRLSGKLCDFITKIINEDTAKKFADFSVTRALDNLFLLDYRLGLPQYSNEYLQVPLKSEIRLVLAPTRTSEVQAPSMPNVPDSDKMMYLMLSDFIFNSAASVARHSRFTVFKLASNKLAGVAAMDLYVTEPLQMRIKSEGIRLRFSGILDLFSEGSGDMRTFLMEFATKVQITVEPRISGEKLHMRIMDVDSDLALRNSSGNVEWAPKLMKYHLEGAIDRFIRNYKINGTGIERHGFPLPMIKGLKFVNTQLRLAERALIVATDVESQAGA